MGAFLNKEGLERLWSKIQEKYASCIKSLSVSGRIITYTRGDGTTGTITTQDTNTTYSPATQSAAGLMSAADKTKLDGIGSGAQANTVTGVKGNAESAYRTGNINLTPANIGAAAASHSHSYLPLSGGTLTGATTINGYVGAKSDTEGGNIFLYSPSKKTYWEMDAYNHNLRLYAQTDGTTRTPLTLDRSNSRMYCGKLVTNQADSVPQLAGNGSFLQMGVAEDQAASQSPDVVIYWNSADGNTFYPLYGDNMILGRPSMRWKLIYSQSSSITTSDRNKKNTIEELTAAKWLDFFLDLKPVTYKMNDGDSGRTHHGFIAQDVEESLARFGFTSLDFAGFCKDQKRVLNPDKTMTVQNPDNPSGVSVLHDPDPDPVFDEEGNPVYEYSLRYEEFLAMTVKAVQSLYVDNQKLSAELGQAQKEIENLKQLETEVESLRQLETEVESLRRLETEVESLRRLKEEVENPSQAVEEMKMEAV